MQRHDLPSHLQPILDRLLDAHAYGSRVRLVANPGTGALLLVRAAAAEIDGGTHRARVGREIGRVLAGLDVPPVGTLAESSAPAPFRAPHHTASFASIFGGRPLTGLPRPGEISVAHGGTLYLDEWPQFSREVRKHLPDVIDRGHVIFDRLGGVFAYPAQPALVIARVTHEERDDPRAAFAGAVDVEIPAQTEI